MYHYDLNYPMLVIHDYVMLWELTPHYWPFLGESIGRPGIPEQRVRNKDVCFFIPGWLNNLLNKQSFAGNLRRHCVPVATPIFTKKLQSISSLRQLWRVGTKSKLVA